MTDIVRDDDVRAGDPRIDGTRITVFDVKRRVVDNDDDPHVVAGEYDISMADLFAALSYYYSHRDALDARERQRASTRRDGERRTRARLEQADTGARNSEQAD